MKGTIQISMKTKFVVIIISSILFFSIVGLIGVIVTVKDISDENISQYRKDIYIKTQEELRNYVQVMVKTIDSFYQRSSKKKIQAEVKTHLKEEIELLFSILNEQYSIHKTDMNTKELKKHLFELIKSARYSKNGYFWVNNMDAAMIMHPIQENLNTKNLMTFQDKNGKFLFKEFVNVAKKDGEGFVSYLWPKPSFNESFEKISLVKKFEPFDWVIGTGDYIDDVTKKLQNEALKTIQEIRYGENGYFWVNDSNHMMIMHPIKKELNGKNLKLMKDADDQYLFQIFVTLTNEKEEGGIVKYMWEKPGFLEPKPKFSYVQKFKPWNWVIGTGAYVDDVEKKIASMKEKTESKIKAITIISAVIFMIVLIVISLVTLALSTRRDNSYNNE